jgi:hypothetical protein
VKETRREVAMARKRKDIVQTRNPRSGHYVKIDRSAGKIISHKRTKGPYKGVPVARRRSK